MTVDKILKAYAELTSDEQLEVSEFVEKLIVKRQMSPGEMGKLAKEMTHKPGGDVELRNKIVEGFYGGDGEE